MGLGEKFKTAGTAAVIGIGSLVATPDAEAASDLFVTQDFIITSNTVVAGGTLPDIGNGTTGFFTLGINTIGAVDQDPSAALGQYAGTIEDFFLSLDTGHAFIIQSPSPLPTSLSDNNIFTGNNFSGSADAFGSIFNVNISELNGSGVAFNGVSGFVDGNNVTDTTSIIGSALDFNNFIGPLDGTGFTFTFNNVALEGTVTSFEVTQVPEPSQGALVVGLVAAGAAFAGRRRGNAPAPKVA